MTIITPLPAERSATRHSRTGAFTLVEVLIGASLSTMILAGVLSAFVFLARSGMNVQHYNDMEAQARKALEYFAEDTRQASAITWTDATTVTLTVNLALIVYSYDSTAKVFNRRDTAGTKALVTGVTQFQFKGFTITGTEITALATRADLATAGRTTKQLQISLEAVRYQDFNASTRTNTMASNTVLSARFILRNKITTA